MRQPANRAWRAMAFGGFGAYDIDAGAKWTLNGVNAVTTGGRLVDAGTLAIIGTMTNAGTIAGMAGGKIILERLDLIGGTLQSATTVSVKDGGNILDGTAGTLTNDAQLIVADAGTLTLEGAIDNAGGIRLAAATSGTDLIVKAAATLSGGGSVVLSANLLNTIVGASTTASLTNVDNTISGSGAIGAGKLVLSNQAAGLIEQTGSLALTINTGTKTVSNAGTIEATGSGGLTIAGAVANTGVLEANKGNLTVSGAVTGTGAAVVNGATLAFFSAFNENVTFAFAGGVLALANSQAYTATITGFSKTGAASLDLRDIGFVSVNEAAFSGTSAGGVLTVTDGTHTARLNLVGSYRTSTWTASSDGSGGVIVGISTAATPAPPSAQAFKAAMASLPAQIASAATSASVTPPAAPMLARPSA